MLEGKLSVIDSNNRLWGEFEILIAIEESNYPHTIPLVFEKSQIINRDWDYHISKKGQCCLDIPHKLLKLKKRGIVLEEFFREVIYPFFANYHFKDATGRYANGEYKHHSEGIIQFYYEEYGLENDKLILNILETSIKGVKYEPNRKCPLCGGNKYKKCCRKIVYQLRQYNKEQLSKDFRVFEQRLNLKG